MCVGTPIRKIFLTPDQPWGWYGLPPGCALLGGFAIGARLSLLWQHTRLMRYVREGVSTRCMADLGFDRRVLSCFIKGRSYRHFPVASSGHGFDPVHVQGYAYDKIV